MSVKNIFRKFIIFWLNLIPLNAKLTFYKIPFISHYLRRLLVLVLGSKGSQIVEITGGPLRGYKMELNLKTQKSFWLGTYEPKIQSILKRIIQKGDVIYDVGAHIGYFALLSSHFCGNEGEVFAFEPDPDNFQLLKKNIEINKIQNIIPVKLAITNKKGVMSFQKTVASSQRHLIEDSELANIDKNSILRVNTESLDNFVYKRLNPPPEIVKIDVEGDENNVIRGMEGIFKKARPIIICEIHNSGADKYIRYILNNFEYQIFNVGLDNYLGVTNPLLYSWGIVGCPEEKSSLVSKIKEFFS